MKDYFDYVSESSEVDIDDDALDVYNEMDAELCEFDSYVQEGVGVAIAASVGGAALIGGLIALITKCFGNSSPNSAARASKAAQRAIDQASELPEEGIEVPTPETIEETKEEVRKEVQDFLEAAQAMLDGRPIPAGNPYSKKKNNSINYASYGSKVDTSGISVKLSEDMIKSGKKEKSEAGVEKLKQSQASGRKNAGTKTVHSKEEAKEAFKQQEQASKEINQMNKDLKTKQQELQKATESGNLKITDEQKKQLEAKRNKAAKAVNAGSNAYRNSANSVLGKLGAGVRKVGKFFGI